jgi:hypothetical protein
MDPTATAALVSPPLRHTEATCQQRPEMPMSVCGGTRSTPAATFRAAIDLDFTGAALLDWRPNECRIRNTT